MSKFPGKLKLSDLLLIALIVLVLIPPVRREISSFIIRLTIRPAKIDNDNPITQISENDLSWEFIDMEGNNYFLKEFENQVVFLNFWATWCPPCRAEMPSIQRLYDEFENDVKFILITNEKPEAINNYLSRNAYSFPVFTSLYPPPEVFFSESIPVTYIISKKGEIILKHKGTAKWDDEKIKSLLNRQINQ